MEDAKDHLSAAKDDIKSAAHDKTAEKIEQVGEKMKGGIDRVIDKVTPEEKIKA